LFTKNGQRFVPAEAVYAAFEIRPTLNKQNLKYAGGKIASVRALHRTSAVIPTASGVWKPREQFDIIGGILTFKSSWSPPFGPAFISSLTQLTVGERLDFGCSLENGCFEATYSTGEKVRVERCAADVSLVTFFFSLLRLLQSKGTAPAINWKEYSQLVG
jgi:hypothetical protein